VCDPACPNDPDCWLAGDTPAQDYHGDLQSSCSLGGPARGRASSFALAALLGLGLGSARRRVRRSSR
jgi:hypothetical protein